MVCGLSFGGTVHFCRAQSGTNVSYIIGSDTTWTQANSPYNFTGNVLVNNGVTLTIGADATVNLNNYYLEDNGSLIIQPGANITIGLIGNGIEVNGVLSAIGTTVNPIYINGNVQNHIFFAFYSALTFSPSSAGWNQQTNSGSIVENVVVTNTEFEVSSGVEISNSAFLSGALTLINGSPTILNDSITTGLGVIGGSPVISNNTITGGLSISAGSGIVADNIISGLSLNDAYGSPDSTLIERNLISNSSIGISCAIQSSVDSEVAIENNTVTNNAVGIQIETPNAPAIFNNNIYGNTLNAKLSGQASSEINLADNWWGTTDHQAINQTIYDFKNDFTVGTVDFVPFLSASNPEALPNPNAPIPTPAPTPMPTPSPTATPTPTPTPSTSPSPPPPITQSQQLISSLPTVGAIIILIMGVAIVAFALGKRIVQGQPPK